MSVETDGYLIDWTEFEKLWTSERNVEFLADAIDDGATWLKAYQDPAWNGSWMAMMDFSDEFREELEGELSPAVANDIRRWLGPFCIADDDDAFVPIRDIPDATDEEEWLFGNLAPATVAKFAKGIGALDLASVKPVYLELDDPAFSGFDQWAGYIRMWKELLLEAQRLGRGILLLAG